MARVPECRGPRDVRLLVADMSSMVLAGVHCTFAGPVDMAMIDAMKPPEVSAPGIEATAAPRPACHSRQLYPQP